MSTPDSVSARYHGHEYLAQNPTWDSEDSPWKAGLVAALLRKNGIEPASLVDIGCGAGVVLAELRREFPKTRLAGYDVAPDASRFWPEHEALGIRFAVGDFNADNRESFDVALLLDVIEHLADPFSFLAQARRHARHFVLHIPLDLSAVSVLREGPLLFVRRKVGHIHYFTKGLALEMLHEAGYEVVDHGFTGASFRAPNRSLRTRLAAAPRYAARVFGADFAARLLGGETLIVLARPR